LFIVAIQLQAHSTHEDYNNKIDIAKIRVDLSLTETKAELLTEAGSRKRSTNVVYADNLKQIRQKRTKQAGGKNI
jgi:hypothetical protein